MFDRDSSSVVRSLIDLLAFRSSLVSKVYQLCSRNSGMLEVAWLTVKDTAAGELIPDPFPQLANETRAKRKFANVYNHR